MTMTPPTATPVDTPRPPAQPLATTGDYLLRQGLLRLLAIKDSDIRLLTLEQCRDAVDKSLHAGGAFCELYPPPVDTWPAPRILPLES